MWSQKIHVITSIPWLITIIRIKKFSFWIRRVVSVKLFTLFREEMCCVKLEVIRKIRKGQFFLVLLIRKDLKLSSENRKSRKENTFFLCWQAFSFSFFMSNHVCILFFHQKDIHNIYCKKGVLCLNWSKIILSIRLSIYCILKIIAYCILKVIYIITKSQNIYNYFYYVFNNQNKIFEERKNQEV